MQSAIVVLVISFIWFYIGSYFLRYIHELISFIHFMMNSFSLVHVFMYGFMVAVILGYYRNVPYNPYMVLSPMLYQRFLVVIIHRLFFSWYSFSLVGYRVDLCVCVGWPNFSFYHIEVSREECYIRKKKWAT